MAVFDELQKQCKAIMLRRYPTTADINDVILRSNDKEAQGLFDHSTILIAQGKQHIYNAADLCREACDKGHPDAAFRMALLHDIGAGVAKSEEARDRFLHLARSFGSAQATLLLAIMAKDKDDDSTYMSLLHEAALVPDQYGANACFGLSQIYFDGNPVPRNPELGYKYLEKAIVGKNSDALCYMGTILSKNPDRDRQAARYLRYAKKAGSPEAHVLLRELGLALGSRSHGRAQYYSVH